MIGLQELNLAYRWPITYWNTAVLTVDAGILEDNGTTNYGKVSTAIGTMQRDDITITPPLINQADNRFKPDADNNRIIYGFQAARGLGSKVINEVISKRPYNSFDDFIKKVDRSIVTDSKMVQLIKSGAFDEFEEKQTIMKRFIKSLMHPVTKLGLNQLNNAREIGVINEESPVFLHSRMNAYKNVILGDNFFYDTVIVPEKKVPKSGYHDRLFKLNKITQEFFKENYSEDSVVDCIGDDYVISEKKFLKEWKGKYIEPLIEWMNQPSVIEAYNKAMYEQLFNQMVKTDPIHWEVEALGYYPKEHELSHVDLKEYGVIDYFELPDQPEPYDYIPRWVKDENGKSVQRLYPRYTISRIAGTVVDFDSLHSTVSLLTPTGVVQIKFNSGQYQFYNRRVSEQDAKGKKTVIDENWFKRNTVLFVVGYRQGDYFKAHKYSDSIYKHTVTRINGYNKTEDGKYIPILQNERAIAEEETNGY